MKISPKLSGEINLPCTYATDMILADLICGCDKEGCHACEEFFRVQDILRPESSDHLDPYLASHT